MANGAAARVSNGGPSSHLLDTHRAMAGGLGEPRLDDKGDDGKDQQGSGGDDHGSGHGPD